jgi:ubiquitin carboxyl-terminal hydrolase 5/13
LKKYTGQGLQAGEVELPEDKPGANPFCPSRVHYSSCLDSEESSALPAFNAEAMAQLEGMGFPTVRCQKALLATGNADPTAAMEWLFAHMEDTGGLLPNNETLSNR